MFHNVIFGQYYPISSKMHFLNPISKIICIILFILLTFFSTTLSLNFCLIILTFLVLALTNMNFITYFKSLKILLPLYGIIILVNFIFRISISETIVMIIRPTLVFLYITMLTVTTSTQDMISGFQKLLFPLSKLKINVPSLALSITLTLRFPYLFKEEFDRILKAQKSRGKEYQNNNIKKKLEMVVSIIKSAFLFTIKKIEMMKKMMSFHSIKTKKQFHWFDGYIIIMHLLILLVIVKKEMII